MVAKTRLLVTGACGFIGSHIATYARGSGEYEVFGVGRCPPNKRLDGVAYFDCDIRDELTMADVFRIVRPQLVSHQAGTASIAEARQCSATAASVNVTGTAVVADLCREYNAKLLFASTHAVYGSLGDAGTPFRETDPVNPRSMYAASKRAAELIVQAAGLNRSVILRYGNVYGSGQTRGLFPAIIRAEQSCKPLELTTPLDSTRDYVHIDELVRLHFKAAEPWFESAVVFNVGSGVSRTLADVLDVAAMFATFDVSLAPKNSQIDEVRHTALNMNRSDWWSTTANSRFVQTVRETLESLRSMMLRAMPLRAMPVTDTDREFARLSKEVADKCG